jgi:hypothetical protein
LTHKSEVVEEDLCEISESTINDPARAYNSGGLDKTWTTDRILMSVVVGLQNQSEHFAASATADSLGLARLQAGGPT